MPTVLRPPYCSRAVLSLRLFATQVVGAELTPSQRDLALWCHFPATQGDPDSFAFFSCTLLNIQVRTVTPFSLFRVIPLRCDVCMVQCWLNMREWCTTCRCGTADGKGSFGTLLMSNLPFEPMLVHLLTCAPRTHNRCSSP